MHACALCVFVWIFDLSSRVFPWNKPAISLLIGIKLNKHLSRAPPTTIEPHLNIHVHNSNKDGNGRRLPCHTPMLVALPYRVFEILFLSSSLSLFDNGCRNPQYSIQRTNMHQNDPSSERTVSTPVPRSHGIGVCFMLTSYLNSYSCECAAICDNNSFVVLHNYVYTKITIIIIRIIVKCKTMGASSLHRTITQQRWVMALVGVLLRALRQ